ncbi:transmembrane protein 225 [Artibeus jamaicensis]|uniref:transmembrane protein 225 n=1 Tax=Artibeus jamaicensis TaxID=9417 RepID=UPI00235A965E|nr:transmembrane protein 225 [Artibeus jamaicensis]
MSPTCENAQRSSRGPSQSDHASRNPSPASPSCNAGRAFDHRRPARAVVQPSTRNIQALNMFFSSWALVFLSLGVMVDDWVTLNFETKTNMQSHSPWIYTTIWPKDDLKVVRIMLILVISFSFFHNLFLGLEFTFMIPQTKYIFLITVFLSFFTGILLLCALLLYHLKLRRGRSVYYSGYKITWIISTAYLSVFFLFASGILCILQYKQAMNSAEESHDTQQSGSSIEVASLQKLTIMPRSIVHVQSKNLDQGSLRKQQSQKRRGEEVMSAPLLPPPGDSKEEEGTCQNIKLQRPKSRKIAVNTFKKAKGGGMSQRRVQEEHSDKVKKGHVRGGDRGVSTGNSKSTRTLDQAAGRCLTAHLHTGGGHQQERLRREVQG